MGLHRHGERMEKFILRRKRLRTNGIDWPATMCPLYNFFS